MPFPADAQPRQLPHADELVGRFADDAEEMGQVDGEASIDDLPGEAHNFSRNAWHFVHDDNRRTMAFYIDRALSP
jgi:hypothetical protein